MRASVKSPAESAVTTPRSVTVSWSLCYTEVILASSSSETPAPSAPSALPCFEGLADEVHHVTVLGKRLYALFPARNQDGVVQHRGDGGERPGDHHAVPGDRLERSVDRPPAPQLAPAPAAAAVRRASPSALPVTGSRQQHRR